MIKYFVIHSKQKVYISAIVPMPPVMGIRKSSFDIPGMCKPEIRVEDTRLEAKDTRKIRGQGQTLSRPGA